MLPSETMIWQPEFTDKTLSRKIGAVQYFVNLLIMELYEEVHNGDAADSVFKSTEPTQVLDNLWSKWQEAIAFFDIWNYPVATEEDLAD
ncbi:hypothetical protein [Escherichia coli]|nr:hypothetical protein [Escherichia coli]